MVHFLALKYFSKQKIKQNEHDDSLVFLLTFFLFLEKCRYNIDLIFVIFIFFILIEYYGLITRVGCCSNF